MPDDSTMQMLQSTPVLKTGDYETARAFYRDKLGYQLVEEGGEPARFGIFKRGRSGLFVDSWHGEPAPVSGAWEAYVHVDGLDALFAEYQAADVNITRPIQTTVYEMREFEVTDPDGNVICFGEDTDPTLRV